VGTVRVGLHLKVLLPPRQRLAKILGAVAIGVIGLGVLAAFLVGRRVARPIGQMVSTLQQMDPAQKPIPLPEHVRDEIGLLTHEVNDMRHRLHDAHLEREQNRRKQMQTQKLAALGNLVAGVAHEVNNPLAGLKNCLRRLGKKDLPPVRRLEYLSLMEESLKRIERVVQQLLHFARIRPPRSRMEHLESILVSAKNLITPVLETQHLRLDLDLSAARDLEVLADAGQIEQALVNLLLNAVYVTPSEGTIWVQTRTKKSAVGVEIRDEGPGIPKEIRQQIENPFFTTKPEGEGTGLGLSVTRTIVDAHHGDLTFQDGPAGGTVAILWLPLAGSGHRQSKKGIPKDRDSILPRTGV
jgi:signal transduction histidine kinase